MAGSWKENPNGYSSIPVSRVLSRQKSTSFIDKEDL